MTGTYNQYGGENDTVDTAGSISWECDDSYYIVGGTLEQSELRDIALSLDCS